MTAARIEVSGFEPYVGLHCETVATGSLLGAAGVELSEPMLFGLGEGLGFIFINLSSLPLPFVGGRVKPFALTTALCKNLGVDLAAAETASKPKSWTSLEQALRAGRPVGLQLDCYHLEYFSRPIHFAGPFVAAYGMDERNVFLVDTAPQGSSQRSSRKSVEAARFEKGPMSAKARHWTIAPPKRKPDLGKALTQAIRSNARDYLSPAFKGASFEGIRKLAASLPSWLDVAKEPAEDLGLAALLMEKAGTGGSLFRNFYRDFLLEARDHLGSGAGLKRAQELFADSAREWAAVAAAIETAGRKEDASLLKEAATRCSRIADIEVEAMRLLAKV